MAVIIAKKILLIFVIIIIITNDRIDVINLDDLNDKKVAEKYV